MGQDVTTDFTPDGSYFLCVTRSGGEPLRALMCGRHAADLSVKKVGQNGRNFSVRHPRCFACDVEAGAERARLQWDETFRHAHECLLCRGVFACPYGGDCEIQEGESFGCPGCQGDDLGVVDEWEKRRIS